MELLNRKPRSANWQTAARHYGLRMSPVDFMLARLPFIRDGGLCMKFSITRRKLTAIVLGTNFIFSNGAFIATSAHALPLEGGPYETAAEVATRNFKVQESYGKLPLAFIQNEGQLDKRVAFYERASGHATYFTKDGIYLSLQTSVRSAPSARETNLVRQGSHSEFVKLSAVGANKSAPIVAEGLQEGKVNYFIGNDPKHWKTNGPTYQAVVYREVYPGVDMRFHGNNRQLEYDIVLRPGADPSKIKFAYEGIEDLEVTADGALLIRLTGGSILQKKPNLYQEIEGKRVAVQGAFKPLGPNSLKRASFAYGFEIAGYNENYPLIIDPTLVYSTYLGGAAQDLGLAIAVDTSGNTYITGDSNSPNFPTVSGGFQSTFESDTNCSAPTPCLHVFVTKLNSAGSALIYSTYLEGSGEDFASGIALDASGNAYVTGLTTSFDFPTTPGTFQQAFVPNSCSNTGGLAPRCPHAFVTKLNSTGSALGYSTYLGGNGGDSGGYTGSNPIAVDASGNAYVTGFTSSTNFPTTAGAIQPTYPGMVCPSFEFLTSPYCVEAFITVLNATGSALKYSSYLGGTGSLNGQDSYAYGTAVAVDSLGNAYVGGLTTVTTGFPTTPDALQPTPTPNEDGFIVKINPTAFGSSSLVYGTFLSGGQPNPATTVNGIAVGGSGHVFVTGLTKSQSFPTILGAFQPAYGGGGADAFVTEIDPSASGSAQLVYSSYLGGNGSDQGLGITVDSSGAIYVTGNTTSTKFPTTAGAFQTSLKGQTNAFLAKIDPSAPGSASLVYSTYLGGSGGDDSGNGITVDGSGNAYLTGYTNSSNFPVTVGAFQTSFGGNYDAFVVKFAADAPVVARGTKFGATEGVNFVGTVAIITDPDPNSTATEYTATIDWGDGTLSSPGTISGPFTVSGTHTYVEEGTYTVTVTIRDLDNPKSNATAISSAIVGDGKLSSSCATLPTSPQTYTGPTAAFTDQSATGTLSDFSATIDWGDATPSSPGTITGGPGNALYTVSGTHTYGSTGTFLITTSIKDVGGSTTTTPACSVTVFAFATAKGAAFVIGDLEAGLGNHVTWWSSQWATINLMSGGAPPNAMKGFAGFEDNFLGLPPPNCGGTWSTDTGNSSPPPPSVPQFMGVIVSSKVTQAGSIISGDIKQVVVVRNDPGYAPDLGHPGTGTEIAIVCMTP